MTEQNLKSNIVGKDHARRVRKHAVKQTIESLQASIRRAEELEALSSITGYDSAPKKQWVKFVLDRFMTVHSDLEVGSVVLSHPRYISRSQVHAFNWWPRDDNTHIKLEHTLYLWKEEEQYLANFIISNHAFEQLVIRLDTIDGRKALEELAAPLMAACMSSLLKNFWPHGALKEGDEFAMKTENGLAIGIVNMAEGGYWLKTWIPYEMAMDHHAHKWLYADGWTSFSTRLKEIYGARCKLSMLGKAYLPKMLELTERQEWENWKENNY